MRKFIKVFGNMGILSGLRILGIREEFSGFGILRIFRNFWGMKLRNFKCLKIYEIEEFVKLEILSSSIKIKRI